MAELERCDQTKMRIRPYRLAHKEREVVRQLISEMLEYGIIQDSNSPYASPILLVKKKTGDLSVMCGL